MTLISAKWNHLLSSRADLPLRNAKLPSCVGIWSDRASWMLTGRGLAALGEHKVRPYERLILYIPGPNAICEVGRLAGGPHDRERETFINQPTVLYHGPPFGFPLSAGRFPHPCPSPGGRGNMEGKLAIKRGPPWQARQ